MPVDNRMSSSAARRSIIGRNTICLPTLNLKNYGHSPARILISKASSADVQRIARQLELAPGYPPKVQMTALAGFIPFQIGDLKSAIEVVRRIPGISDAGTPAIQAEWEGKTIRVLDPISLLACKLELAATVSQEKRQDVAHLKILLPCVRAFLGELLQQVDLGKLPAKDWLKVANQVLKLTTDHRARKIAEQTSDQLAGNSAAEYHRQKPERENQTVSGTAVGTGLQKIKGRFHLM
jgi:hypothetical protein